MDLVAAARVAAVADGLVVDVGLDDGDRGEQLEE
jgi:hypothetical protein